MLQRVKSLDTGRCFVTTLATSDDGRFIAGAGGGADEPGCVVVWDGATGERLATCKTDRATVAALAFAPNGKLLASSCWPDASVQLWRIPSLEKAATLNLIPKHTPPLKSGVPRDETVVSSLTFSADGKYLAAGCWDLRVKLWDVRRHSLTELDPNHEESVDFVTFLSGHRLVSAAADVLWVWDLNAGAVAKKVRLLGEAVWKHTRSPNGRYIASIGRSGRIRLTDTETWKHVTATLKFNRRVTTVQVSPDSSEVALALEDGRLYFWRPSTKGVHRGWKVDNPVSSLCYSHDGRTVAVSEIAPRRSAKVTFYARRHSADE